MKKGWLIQCPVCGAAIFAGRWKWYAKWYFARLKKLGPEVFTDYHDGQPSECELVWSSGESS